MRGIVYPEIDAYLERLANRGGEGMVALEREGHRDGWPIVGAGEGSLLFLLARALGARRVLELGTAIGYSASWLAMAVGPEGRVLTVEGVPATADLARGNLERLHLADRVEVRVGRAEEVVKALPGPFDLAFNDIDKAAYPVVLEDLVRLLRVGGLLVTDNVLWSGDVARGGRSKDTRAIREYNERLARDPRMHAVIVPLRDGVSLALKVSA